jgi:hypothetical protein
LVQQVPTTQRRCQIRSFQSASGRDSRFCLLFDTLAVNALKLRSWPA